MSDDLHDEIDALALTIEQQIDEGEQFLDDLDFEPDPMYRRMADAEVPDVEVMFG